MSIQFLLTALGVALATSFVGSRLVSRPISPPGHVLALQISVTPILPAEALSPTKGEGGQPTPTSTPIPTPRPRPTATPSPTPIPVPKYSSEQIYHLIDQYAGEYHVDPNVLRHIAICETGFNPSAKNHIYAGLFQYDAPTWKAFRKLQGLDPDPDLRYNAQEAVRTTAYLLSQNRAYLWPNCTPK